MTEASIFDGVEIMVLVLSRNVCVYIMGKWFVVVTCLVCLMITTKQAYVSTFPGIAMYVLGDSSVDCGDNTPLGAFIPNNLSQFPCNGSDATLLPHLVAKKMGLPYSRPFYSQNGSITEIIRGINFGSAEASILYPGSLNYQSLNQQLRQAFETLQLLQLRLGPEKATDFTKTSIFYLSFGKVDFLRYFLSNRSSLTAQNLSHILVHQMTIAIRSLYASNVRKIVCAGVLPLGCTPHLMTSSGPFDEANTAITEYNTLLQQSIASINTQLQDAHIIFCDVYKPVMDFIKNPKPYGLDDVKNACCQVSKYAAGGGGGGGCFSTDTACAESSTHVWWDLNNPTPSVNSLLADSMWTVRPISSICSPMTLQQLLFSK